VVEPQDQQLPQHRVAASISDSVFSKFLWSLLRLLLPYTGLCENIDTDLIT